MLSTSKTGLVLFKHRKRIFERGDKASECLAYQAYSAAVSRLITKIKSLTVVIADTRDINLYKRLCYA